MITLTKTRNIEVGDRVAYKRNKDGVIIVGTVTQVYLRGIEMDRALDRWGDSEKNMFVLNPQLRKSNIAYRMRLDEPELVQHPVAIAHDRLIEVEDPTETESDKTTCD